MTAKSKKAASVAMLQDVVRRTRPQAEKPATEPETPPETAPEEKDRLTVTLPVEIAERVRNLCWWQRRRLSDFLEDAVRSHLEQKEKESKYKGPAPIREADLAQGRPPKSPPR